MVSLPNGITLLDLEMMTDPHNVAEAIDQAWLDDDKALQEEAERLKASDSHYINDITVSTTTSLKIDPQGVILSASVNETLEREGSVVRRLYSTIELLADGDVTG